MKLETSVDTQLKKELGKLEDGTEEITQNAVYRDNGVENRRELKTEFLVCFFKEDATYE